MTVPANYLRELPKKLFCVCLEPYLLPAPTHRCACDSLTAVRSLQGAPPNGSTSLSCWLIHVTNILLYQKVRSTNYYAGQAYNSEINNADPSPVAALSDLAPLSPLSSFPTINGCLSCSRPGDPPLFPPGSTGPKLPLKSNACKWISLRRHSTSLCPALSANQAIQGRWFIFDTVRMHLCPALMHAAMLTCD